MADRSASAVIGVDSGEVARGIVSLGIPVTRPLTFERIGLGRSNLTYLVRDAAGHQWVLRRPPMGDLLDSAHDVAREGRIVSALHNTDVPTPRIYGLIRDSEDVPLLLMEFVDGVVIDRMSVAQSLTPQRRRNIGLALPKMLAKIHAVDLDAVGLTDLASHRPYAQRQLKRWSGQWEKSKTRELPALDELTDRLTAAAPQPRELTLVHGDFHIRNAITRRGGDDIVAVLDWELSTLGDPLADLGSLLAYWPQPDEDDIAGDFAVITLDGFPRRAELTQTYLDETGRDPAELAYWYALGLWKSAIIVEGIIQRLLDNPQNAAEVPMRGWVDALIGRACRVADEAGI